MIRSLIVLNSVSNCAFFVVFLSRSSLPSFLLQASSLLRSKTGLLEDCDFAIKLLNSGIRLSTISEPARYVLADLNVGKRSR